MSKGRRVHREKELDELQKAKKTIEKLKRENSSLRKQIQRAVNTERMVDLHDLVLKQRQEQLERERAESKKAKEKEKRKCFSCKEGHMRLTLWPRKDGVFYNRICSRSPQCGNRTKFKKYNPDKVEGILEETEKEKLK